MKSLILGVVGVMIVFAIVAIKLLIDEIKENGEK